MTEAPPAPPAGAAPVTLDLGELLDDWEGQTITIRPHLSFAASQRIEAARMEMSAHVQTNRRARREAGADMEMTARVTSVDYAVAVVEEAVISWTLTGHNAKLIRANREGINSQHAPAQLLDTAIAEIVDYYEERTPKLRKRSS